MSPLFRNESTRKKHDKVLARTLPLLPAGAVEYSLVVIDDKDGDRAMRKGDRALVLGHAEPETLLRLGERGSALTYDPARSESAQAALLAAAVPPGMPIAGDTESLALLTLAERIGGSDIPVLVEGPTGTGKEVLARHLHRASTRRDGPFVAVNCAAMPEAMLEALLFGHRKGAFTGASEAGEGFFRAADGGTLLLDELGEMPLALQSKILRALQEGEVVPLGATKPVKVDVRIIACTNRELSREVEEGRFREDLFYRLNVFPLRLAALRERTGDIAPLAFGMLLRHACREGMPTWIAKDALDLLCRHPWPGNVRELENVIRRAILLAGDGPCIEAEHIRFDSAVRPVAPAEPAPADADGPAESSLSDIAFRSESEAILSALDRFGGHRGKTARELGISERTLRYRLATMRDAGLAVAGAGR